LNAWLGRTVGCMRECRQPSIAECSILDEALRLPGWGQKATSPPIKKRRLKVRLAPRKGHRAEVREALKDSLISNLFSLFCPNKFPVRTRTSIRQKCPRVEHILTKTTSAEDPISQDFPCIFPC